MRENKEKEMQRSKSKPGSGKCWKKGITISEEFHLATEQNSINRSSTNIRALNKPIVLNKFNFKTQATTPVNNYTAMSTQQNIQVRNIFLYIEKYF